MGSPPEPKRRNAALTRSRILDAANAAFAERGYTGAGLREIAAKADVASSLLIRYFGTKAGLFEAALIRTIEDNSIFTLEKPGFGARMARLVLEESNIRITTLFVLALADPESKTVSNRVAQARVLQPLAEWLGPPDAHARAMNLFSLLTGFAIQMHALQTGTIPSTSLHWLAESLQRIVDND